MEPLYSKTGIVDADSPGWDYIPMEGPEKTFNKVAGVYENSGARLESPLFDVEDRAFSFMKLSYEYSMPDPAGSGLCAGLYFYGETGNTYPDIYVDLAVTEDGFTRDSRVFYGRKGAVNARVFFQTRDGVRIRNVAVAPVLPDEAARWCDELYRGLPQLDCALQPDRHRYIPRTIEAMQSGKPWRVVMLGDSIVNDTFNSNCQALIQRLYPESRLEFICSVRGSTGCRYYRQPENFREYVAVHAPDLLVIGGVSNVRDCTDDEAMGSIRDVVNMAREEAGCEVLLLTGPLGGVWRAIAGGDAAEEEGRVDQPPVRFWHALERLADEMHIAFLDQGSIWHDYLERNGVDDPLWYHRDLVHGNRRGQQVAGRMLESFFAPE